MKQNLSFKVKLLCIMILTVMAKSSSAQVISLVKDINKLGSGSSGSPNNYTSNGSVCYFKANNWPSGTELWITDGTPAGTHLVYDETTSASGSPSNLSLLGNNLIFNLKSNTDIKDHLYFTNGTSAGTKQISYWPSSTIPVKAGNNLIYKTADTLYGSEIWTTDGTVAGTMLLRDIHQGTANSNPIEMKQLGNLAFFIDDQGSNDSLFVTDGTPAGTIPLLWNVDINTPTVVAGSLYYFLVNGTDLWCSDGTPGGTIKLLSGNSISKLTAYGKKLVFSAWDTMNGHELWVSDGTVAGTKLIKNINTIGDANPNQLYNGGNYIYFSADSGDANRMLWRTDGTDTGTIWLFDIEPAQNKVVIYGVYGLGNRVVIDAENAALNREYWMSDGTAAGTGLLKDFRPGSGNGNPASPYVWNNILYFNVDTNGKDREPWITDGTIAGTKKLKDINPSSSNAQWFTQVNGKVVFTADDAVNGNELWVTDGTDTGTVLLKNCDAGTNASGPDYFVEVGDKTFFQASSGTSGTELWMTDGTESGTSMVKDIYVTGSSNPWFLSAYKNKVYFSAQDTNNNISLWMSDGTSSGTSLVKEMNPGPKAPDWDRFMMEVNGKLLFVADTVGKGRRLCVSDGTTAGTTTLRGDSLKNVYGIWKGNPDDVLTRYNNKIVFSGFNNNYGSELWISDGTDSGTYMVKDLNPGPAGSNPFEIGVLGNKILYSGIYPGIGDELCVSDGTAAGTDTLMDINQGSNGSQINYFVQLGNMLMFTADDVVHGREFWKTDGTRSGTQMLKDIKPGSNGSDVDYEYPTLLNGKMYFTANDGIYGRELWVTDGTDSGTMMLKDINQGSNDSRIWGLTTYKNKIYFSANDGVHGSEIWESDGTTAGTKMLKDMMPGPMSGDLYDYFLPGGKKALFLSCNGYTGKDYLNYELWKISDCGKLNRAVVNPSLNTAFNFQMQDSLTTCHCDLYNDLISTVVSSGTNPIKGNINAMVWNEASNITMGAITACKRHYEITPDTLTNTATGKVTLYYTQNDFDSFNVASTVKMPTNANDINKLKNLVIALFKGKSKDGSAGMPSDYPSSTPDLIKPDRSDVVWNDSLKRWEVTFNTIGFGGYFLGTQSCPDVINTKALSINQGDSVLFKGKYVKTAGTYIDTLVSAGGCDSIYTLNLTVISGINEWKYNTPVIVYPNPTKGSVNIESSSSESWKCTVSDITGKTILTTQFRGQINIDLHNFSAGIYFIKLFGDKQTIEYKISKE